MEFKVGDMVNVVAPYGNAGATATVMSRVFVQNVREQPDGDHTATIKSLDSEGLTIVNTKYLRGVH